MAVCWPSALTYSVFLSSGPQRSTMQMSVFRRLLGTPHLPSRTVYRHPEITHFEGAAAGFPASKLRVT